MPEYRRAFQPGGTFFFTLVTEGRAPLLDSDASRRLLHEALVVCAASRPFDLVATVLLPEHLHLLLTLPAGDADFSSRLSMLKAHFTRGFLAAGGPEQGRSLSRIRQRARGVWQRRFWEHAIRDEDDLRRHLDYIHYNPVKHGLCACQHAWPYSSFSRWVSKDAYPADWCCACDGRSAQAPIMAGMEQVE